MVRTETLEKLGEASVRSNYDVLKGVLTAIAVDSTRHAYLMSNLDRLWEAYVRAWEKANGLS